MGKTKEKKMDYFEDEYVRVRSRGGINIAILLNESIVQIFEQLAAD